MPEVDQPDSDTNETTQPNRNPLSAAYARFKLLPIGLRRIVVSASLLWLIVILVSVFLPNLRERVRFFTESTLSLFVLLVVTVQAYIYRRQWEVMDSQRVQIERSIDTAEKSSIWAQRAYVVAKIHAISRTTIAEGLSLGFRLRITNDGNTPANNVSVHYKCELRESPPWDMYSTPFSDMPDQQIVFDSSFERSERLGVMAPNGGHYTINTPETSFQSPAEHRAFGMDQVKLFCWGRIVYETIFNQTRHTDFCFYQSQSHPDGYPCEHGNEAI